MTSSLCLRPTAVVVVLGQFVKLHYHTLSHYSEQKLRDMHPAKNTRLSLLRG